ncbi:glutamate 5-kinase [Longirhabdus pacifica]|uniref:glutamate 5-kinase n=1 Tax=Longirhabdus pacifica TaxID=2305227 RepID=UPI0010087DB3|nr:glutamate 5-kinase [Longirhabdus pacifica]
MKKVVVKIGSSSLTSREGGLDHVKIKYYAKELASLVKEGIQVIFVTSGAIAAGFKAIGYSQKPSLLHEKQAAAAVGQALLMQAYQQQLAPYGIGAAQILLTRSDFSERHHIRNALSTIEELIRRNYIPIINENDTVAVDEIKFGDNDTLSALVANMIKADKLLIFTDTDGLYTADPFKDEKAERIEVVKSIDAQLMQLAGDSSSKVGTGGMRSKIEAARIATRGGVPVFIGKITQENALLKAVNGEIAGTAFDAASHNLPMKKQWIGFHSKVCGRIYIDQGAEEALLHRGKSLLPAGVQSIEGEFHPGDVVEVMNATEHIVGKGVSNYSSRQLKAAAGLSTGDVKQRLEVHRIEVIHRDEWMTLTDHIEA